MEKIDIILSVIALIAFITFLVQRKKMINSADLGMYASNGNSHSALIKVILSCVLLIAGVFWMIIKYADN